MNDDTFNLSIRKFLKRVGVGSQREMEHAIEAAIKAGIVAGNESLPCRMTLEIDRVKLKVVYDGSIELECRARSASRSGQLARRDMIQRDHPLTIALAHQSSIDAVLRLARSIQAITADELGGIRRQ